MKHTLRIHAATETTNQPLPEVILSRIRTACNNTNRTVNPEAHIALKRERIGQPRHEKIIISCSHHPTTRFDVPTATLTDTQARDHLGWTTGTYQDYDATPPAGCDNWLECEQEPPEKQLSNRPLPETVWFDYFEDSQALTDYNITVENHFDMSQLVDYSVDEITDIAEQELLFDVPWYVVEHMNETVGWHEVTRHGEVPESL